MVSHSLHLHPLHMPASFSIWGIVIGVIFVPFAIIGSLFLIVRALIGV
jgi:hypothetical protein